MYESNYDKLQNLGIDLRNKRSGQHKVTCPRCSLNRKHKKEPSLSVNIDTGEFNCHNTPCDFRGSVGFVAVRPEKVYAKPIWTNITTLPEPVVKWFKEERGISQKTLIETKIGFGMKWFYPSEKKNIPAGEAPAIWFPYFRNDSLVNIKYRDVNKRFMMHKDAELIFYNLDSLRNSKIGYIVEGEIDVLSVIETGILPVVSVPNGASLGKAIDMQYLDNCIDAFEHLEKIVIATDDDPAGRALKDELIRRLGAERCWTVDFGGSKQYPQVRWKDSNEVLVGKTVDGLGKVADGAGAIALQAVLENAVPVPIKGIKDIRELHNDIFDLFNKGLPPGDSIGRRDAVGELLTYAPGQLTVVTGMPNHGKSEVVDQDMCMLAVIHKWKFGVWSPENWPLVLHLCKLIEKLIGKQFSASAGYTNRITPEEIQMGLNFIYDHFYFIHPDDNDEEDMTLDRLLEYGKMMVKRYGIKGFLIDPWNTIEHQRPANLSDTEYVSWALGKINKFDRVYSVHTFLVAHPTKLKKEKRKGSGELEYPVPTLYDISGSAHFRNKAFNGFSVYRDFNKNVTEVHYQKIKFKHQGHVGVWQASYDVRNGRFRSVNEPPDMRNWITQGATPYVQPTIVADDENDVTIHANDGMPDPF